MKNFEKLTVAKEAITDEETGASVSVLIYRDASGEDWLDVAAANPHAYYIAVNDNGMVVCMADQADMIQLDGLTMYGIDESFGFEGRDALGKLWNGSDIVEPDPEPIVQILPAVTLWERMTEAEAEQVAEVMAAQPFRTRKIFETAATFRSDHELWPLLEQIAHQLFGEARAAELLAA
ncbi:hypothetical protein [Ochrobactrum sp. MYb379]|uniref:hypothetical protein n=1 Tax=Ochrobactrum sp. MYb379 TaxID=2745275 RepID=UPI00309D8EEB